MRKLFVVLSFASLNLHAQSIKLTEYLIKYNSNNIVEYIDLIFTTAIDDNEVFDVTLTKEEFILYNSTNLFPAFVGLNKEISDWYIVINNEDTVKSFNYSISAHKAENYKKIKVIKNKDEKITYQYRINIPKEVLFKTRYENNDCKLIVYIHDHTFEVNEDKNFTNRNCFFVNFRCRN
jgi:hypothetical protein